MREKHECFSRCQIFVFFFCLANLDVRVFVDCCFIVVFPHIVPLLKATANLSQLRLSLLK